MSGQSIIDSTTAKLQTHGMPLCNRSWGALPLYEDLPTRLDDVLARAARQLWSADWRRPRSRSRAASSRPTTKPPPNI